MHCQMLPTIMYMTNCFGAGTIIVQLAVVIYKGESIATSAIWKIWHENEWVRDK